MPSLARPTGWRRLPWWLPVALLALGLRLAHLAAEQPTLRFSTSQHYFTGGLEVAQHPDPLGYILRDDGWHLFNDVWTVAPLYPLFVAAVLKLLGARLLWVQLVQAGLEALTAVAFGALGRRVSPRFGAWAGVAYAAWWPAIDFAGQTMTEGLHNALMAAAFLALAAVEREGQPPRLGRAALGGALLGVAALARPVSLTFVPLAGLILAWRAGRRQAPRLFAAVALAGTLSVAPWTARNVVFTGDFVVIESISAYTLWYDNAFVKPGRYGQQDRAILEQPTPAARRAKAVELALLNLRTGWRELPEKVETAVRHLVRPAGLYATFVLGEPESLALRLARLLGDDLLLLASLALLPAALAGVGRRLPLLLVAAWVGYVTFMLVVVFHTEVRYRMGLVPPLFTLAAAGLEFALDPDPLLRRRARRAALLGGLAAALVATPYAGLAWRAARAAWRLRPLAAAVERGDLAAAEGLARWAAEAAPASAQPWLRYGRLLAWAGRPAEAAAAYEEAERRQPECWLPSAVLPQLLRQAGRDAEADERLEALTRAFKRPRAWEPLEAAWRELPPPVADELQVGRDDAGALRRFADPRGGARSAARSAGRWSQPGAALRLQPTHATGRYRVTLELASPEPSPLAAPHVRVRCAGAAPAELRLTRAPAPYSFECAPGPGRPLVVELDAPVWNRPGRPVDAGVLVTRMSVDGR